MRMLISLVLICSSGGLAHAASIRGACDHIERDQVHQFNFLITAGVNQASPTQLQERVKAMVRRARSTGRLARVRAIMRGPWVNLYANNTQTLISIDWIGEGVPRVAADRLRRKLRSYLRALVVGGEITTFAEQPAAQDRAISDALGCR